MTPRSLLAPARFGGQPILRAQTDERLVELARSGSIPALEAIVSRYRRPLVSYSARFLGGERAEDAVQQTFVKACAALSGGEVVLNLRPWLYRIAHNTSLNMLRDKALHHEQLSDQMDGVERPDQVAERRQELDGVLRAVKALPARQRDAIVLRAIEGRSYEEIAASLGVTDGAVRQLLSRARCGVRAGVAAVTPVGLLARIAAPFGDAPITIAAGGGGGTATASKMCAAAVAAALAGGGASALPEHPRAERAPDPAASAVQVRAPEADASRPAGARSSRTRQTRAPAARPRPELPRAERRATSERRDRGRRPPDAERRGRDRRAGTGDEPRRPAGDDRRRLDDGHRDRPYPEPEPLDPRPPPGDPIQTGELADADGGGELRPARLGLPYGR